ncbi:sulfotransferase 1C4-like isoform X3 [Anneissia japonica]|nr:sulfotransferase 1C4-like isoform X3 [Anneissia japonica]
MQEIVSVLFHGCDIQKADEVSIWKRFVFLDQQKKDAHVSPHDEATRKPSPRLIKTHLPPQHMAKQLTIKRPKIVYVGRNPKDNAVSLYNFYRANTYLRTYETWNEFFEAFCADDVIYGSWFDMNIYWWNLRNEDNVLFIKYEDMKKDLASVIEGVSEFFGWPISDGKLQDIVKHCTFDSMKKNPKANLSDNKHIDQSISAFLRKGEVGDWKNYFTKAQNTKFDKKYAEKMNGSSLTFEFEL